MKTVRFKENEIGKKAKKNTLKYTKVVAHQIMYKTEKSLFSSTYAIIRNNKIQVTAL